VLLRDFGRELGRRSALKTPRPHPPRAAAARRHHGKHLQPQALAGTRHGGRVSWVHCGLRVTNASTI